MAGIGGINPVTISLYTQPIQFSALRPGQILQGIVEGNERQLLLRLGSIEVPLEPVSGVQAGQAVSAEVVQSDRGLQLRLTPLPTASPPPSAAPPSADLATVLTSVLEGIGRLDLAREAVHLIPNVLPNNPDAIRSLLGLFLGQGDLAGDLNAIAAAIEQAVNAGALTEERANALLAAVRQSVISNVRSDLAPSGGPTPPVEQLNAFSTLIREQLGALPPSPERDALLRLNRDAFDALVRRFLERDSALAKAGQLSALLSARDPEAIAAATRRLVAFHGDEFASHLRRVHEHPARTLEARLALAAASDKVETFLVEIADDLRTQLHRLRTDDAFTHFLRNTGQTFAFERAVDRVLERLFAAQLQNLHSAEAPYAFFEVPFAGQFGVDRAQVHVFGDGRRGSHTFDDKNSTLVLDLSVSKLGDLWISLNVVNNACACWIRATRADVVETVDELAEELSDRLRETGFAAANVHASLWDGNRIAEAAQLMRRFEGIDFEA